MEFNSVGAALGVLSAVIHFGQATVVILKHFKIQSTCCNLRSSFEMDIDTSPVQQKTVPINNVADK